MIALAAAGLHSQSPDAAHVLDLKGTWKIAGNKVALVRGQGLTQGESIVAASNQPGDMIVIVRAQDLSRLQIVCDATPQNPCHAPIAVQPPGTPAPAATSHIATLLQAAFSLLMGSSPATASQYATTMTRSFPAEKLQENVVALSADGTLALPHSPGGIPAGHYTLQIVPVGSDTHSQQAATLNLGGAWQPIPFSTTGLFEISVRDAQDHHVDNIMLLVANSGHVEDLLAAFNEAKGQSDTWIGADARHDEHLFLRAFLQSESNAK
jgi:hypothetical protein